MIVTLSTAANTARLAGLQTFIDYGTGKASIRLYNETLTPGVAPTTLPIVNLVLAKPCGVLTDVLTLAQDDSDGTLIARDGAPTMARMVNGNGDWVMDLDVTTTTGTGAIKLEQADLRAGGRAPLFNSTIG